MSGAILDRGKPPQWLLRPRPSHSIGGIVAHEAIVIEPVRAGFRAVEPEDERPGVLPLQRGGAPRGDGQERNEADRTAAATGSAHVIG